MEEKKHRGDATLVMSAVDKQGLSLILGALWELNTNGILARVKHVHSTGVANLLALQWMKALHLFKPMFSSETLTSARCEHFHAPLRSQRQQKQDPMDENFAAHLALPFMHEFLYPNHESTALRMRLRRPCEWFRPWADAIRETVVTMFDEPQLMDACTVDARAREQARVPIFNFQTSDYADPSHLTTAFTTAREQAGYTSIMGLSQKDALNYIVSAASDECTIADDATRPCALTDAMSRTSRQYKAEAPGPLIFLDGVFNNPRVTRESASLLKSHVEASGSVTWVYKRPQQMHGPQPPPFNAVFEAGGEDEVVEMLEHGRWACCEALSARR